MAFNIMKHRLTVASRSCLGLVVGFLIGWPPLAVLAQNASITIAPIPANPSIQINQLQNSLGVETLSLNSGLTNVLSLQLDRFSAYSLYGFGYPYYDSNPDAAIFGF